MSFSGSGRVNLPFFDVAMLHLQMGYSVIPVYGDSDVSRPKAAAVEWRPYQMRPPSQAELARWFRDGGYRALAIVTGRVSGLVVLDFDDPALAALFERRFPALTQTRVVESAGRGLPHYYFRLPRGSVLPSRRVPGIDLLSDGRYVVAPPSSIAGAAYRVRRAGLPLMLTPDDVRRLCAFLDEVSQAARVPVENPVQKSPQTPAWRLVLTHQAAQAAYATLKDRIGRNEALFRVALRARDAGWDEPAARALLAGLHVQSRLPTETPAARLREAVATIRSAYSRKPRKQPTAETLPNTLREALLRHDRVQALRVLERLLLAGVPAGAALTEREMLALIAPQVGRYTLLAALRAALPDGGPVFEQAGPFPTPHTPTAVAIPLSQDPDKKCSQIGVTASDKKGRPPRRYLVPSVASLCARLHVVPKGGDALAVDDLSSPARYRQALHREFVRRRPGAHYVRWLADRLFVCERTCQRYNRALGIDLQPTYERTPLHPGNARFLDESRRDMFLEDAAGRRYPLRVRLAQQLLAAGRALCVVRQGFNCYALPAAACSQTAPQAAQQAQNGAQSPLEVSQGVNAAKTAENGLQPVLTPLPAPKTNTPRLTKRQLRQPLPDRAMEVWAQRLHRVTAERRSADASALSLANARRLVAQYGLRMVQRVLGVVASRTNIRSVAGFVVSWLRSEARAAQLSQIYNLS
jgi:hypothetical protein